MALPSVLAIAAVVLWAGYEVLLRRRDDSGTASWQGGAGDRGSTRLLLAAYALSVVLVVLLAGHDAGRVPTPWRWAGVALAVAGLAVRAWGMRTLGRFYTRTLRTTEGHRVVREGPYRLIRHPGYSGSLLVWSGYALATAGWIAFLLVAAVLLAAYSWRIAAEERLLLAAFGAEYAGYRRDTKRLVPFLY
ncbi:hypothetical protein GCM10010218_56000 [Streptomyces mashuensis]|uniref:Isoprenylcysteine carboxyl methyltransferase n=1 Tax=Streptomyces mashuensis TaxID=33904 RepID=A0A919EFZ8_9ACTN|nr:isoprenylcysteine carboxylmethyltransferase family protein [Streptomyces mashuensis]GHF67319.1 hypothetical protein GCM10010218_56000 [Streptomyces mashuensis]